MEEDTSGSIDFEYFMEDMSEERSTRVAGAIMIIIGSLLGVQFGILQISGTPDEILSGSLDFSERYSDVNGITISSLEGNSSGGDPVEGVKIRLLSEEGATTGRETTSDSNGRFSFDSVIRKTSILEFTHPGNITMVVIFVPGDNADLAITISPGEGEQQVDLSGESFLAESVSIATAIAVLTVIVGLAGVYGGVEAYRGDSYRRSWWLGFLGLWSRGMIFIGPLLILVGMGLVTLCKDQFSSENS
ncbi:MAG: hypothetical protein CMA28_01920 [Euryarchaeota archaeon]|nr:hypothetical protein [Euryarchaeota archaeon]|tara:strand:+ start:1110 stop:1847 length:738 start_codon:yes stop_codon:yes gene_type:complete